MITQTKQASPQFEAVAEMVIALRTAYEKDLTVPRRGRATKRSFEDIVSSIGWIKPMQAIFDANPVIGYACAAFLRRDLTNQEKESILASDEVAGQGILPNDEPAQEEVFIQSPIRLEGCDSQGAAFVAEVKRVVRMAQAVSQMEKVELYIRYVPNVVIRAAKSLKDAEGNTVKSLGKAALRAQFGGRLYASDRSTHNGTLLAITTPNAGARTALGRVEWQAPGFGG
jgi:hypothetical protein